MKPTLRTLALAFAIVLSIGITAHAQNGVAEGHVTDREGKPAAGLDVQIDRVDIAGMKFTAKTDKSGDYYHAGIPFGEYTYTVLEGGKAVMVLKKRMGFYNPEKDDSDRNEVDFDLRKAPKPGSVEAEAIADGMQKTVDRIKQQNEAGVTSRQVFAEGLALSKAGKCQEALEKFQKTTELDPKQTTSITNSAIMLNCLKKYEEAIAAYEKAISMKPDSPENPDFVYEIGMIYRRMEKWDESVATLLKAAEAKPAIGGKSHFAIGETHEKNAKYPDALKSYQKSAELDPKFADPNIKIAMIMVRDATTIPDAGPYAEKYLKLAPNGPEAETAKALIKLANDMKGASAAAPAAADPKASQPPKGNSTTNNNKK